MTAGAEAEKTSVGTTHSSIGLFEEMVLAENGRQTEAQSSACDEAPGGQKIGPRTAASALDGIGVRTGRQEGAKHLRAPPGGTDEGR